MEQQNGFSYTYSAQENQEVLNIRKKYLPQEESKLEELKRLDHLVQNSGVTESLCAGIGGCLVFGVSMCFGLAFFGSTTWPCIPLGLVGTIGMLLAYPIYRRCFNQKKRQYAPRILELSAQLSETTNN